MHIATAKWRAAFDEIVCCKYLQDEKRAGAKSKKPSALADGFWWDRFGAELLHHADGRGANVGTLSARGVHGFLTGNPATRFL